ncbi:LacI family DNA-binding transcriptional regulator [Leifsonia sp. 2MCAF36]|uniref:LacI family DNA-binding transcriptional regulator n=1 Tax=Leifsonia sp. 2MCAF36 TaxID=3232988 RepID=UPI003F9AA89B
MATRRSPKPTLDDVAALAGVSRATASRVLNGGVRSTANIDPEVREAVFAAARSLDYTANTQAQAMSAGASSTVAILVSEIDDPGSSALVSGALKRARETGHALIVGLSGLTETEELDALRALRGQRPKAVVVAVSRTTDAAREDAFREELTAFADAGGRVSVIGANSFGFDEVLLRNADSSAALARALIGLGYRRFAIVAASADQITSHERQRGFMEEAERAGFATDPDLVVSADFDRDGGYAAAGALIDRLDDIDAIFAVSDAIALGVIARLRENGVAVPGRVAVAGFDDVPVVRDLTPPLTTVRIPLEEMAAHAVDQVLGESGAAGPQTLELTGEVVVRASTPAKG